MEMLRPLMFIQDQRFQGLDERLATGGSREESESNSDRKYYHGVLTDGISPAPVGYAWTKLERKS